MTPWEARQIADERGVCPLCKARSSLQTNPANVLEKIEVFPHEERCPVPDAKPPGRERGILWTPWRR